MMKAKVANSSGTAYEGQRSGNGAQQLTKAIATIFMLGAALSSMAQEGGDIAKCLSTKDASKRLECYDTIAKATLKNVPRKVSAEEEKKIADQNAMKAEEVKLKLEAEQNSAKAEQLARDVLKAARRLQTKVQTGISYKELSPAIAEAKLEIAMFSETPAAKQYVDFTKYLTHAISNYEFANKLWAIKFQTSYAYLTDKALTQALMSMYPEVAQSKENGVNLHIEETVSTIFGVASKDVDKATKTLNPK